MRPMRRIEKEITDRTEIEAVLADARICRLGLVDEGEPYVVPVCFGYRDGKVYVHSASEGRKMDLMRANPRVCLEFEADCQVQPARSACVWGVSYRSVIAWGSATVLEDREEVIQALNVMMAQYGGPPVSTESEALARVVAVCIDIDTWTGKESE